jgi:hypothetical protein
MSDPEYRPIGLFEYPPPGLTPNEIAHLALVNGRGFYGVGTDDDAPRNRIYLRWAEEWFDELSLGNARVVVIGNAFGGERNPAFAGLAYGDYLRTPHWQAMRKLKLLRSFHICQNQGCGTARGPMEIHHLTYDRLGWEREADLIVLCHACHAREHGAQP